MKLIELWAMEGRGQTGLDGMGMVILHAATGIEWANQTDGICCRHPKIEGFAIPVAMSAEIVEELHGLVCLDAVASERTVVAVNEILEGLAAPIAIAPGLPTLREAWLEIVVKRCCGDVPEPEYTTCPHAPLWHPLVGMTGVLTYGNCD